MRHKRLPAAAGLLLALALPILVSAHEIVNVDVDCDAQTIDVTSKDFGAEGGVTVSVTGPDGYMQSFFADQDAEWTVTVPLGHNGSYMIDWPNSGDFGPVGFEVTCEEGGVLPTSEPTVEPTSEPTSEPTTEPTAEPTGAALPIEEIPPTGPQGAVLPAVGTGAGAGATLPPTDTATNDQEQTGGPISPACH